MAEDEALLESLGEVPIAVAEKGKGAGSHLLSGAVMKPQAMKDLFPEQIDEIPRYNDGDRAGGRLFPDSRTANCGSRRRPRCTTRATGSVSVSQMGRWMAEQAEEAGAFIAARDPTARKFSSTRAGWSGLSPETRAGAKRVRSSAPSSRASRVRAKVTIFAEGTQGHLSQVARQYFQLDDESTQIWELGVKEVWEVEKPLDKVIHTLGWPLHLFGKHAEYGGSWIYPMGEDKVSLGFVVGPGRGERPACRPTTCFRSSRTPKFVRGVA